jgi:hypothetical protein
MSPKQNVNTAKTRNYVLNVARQDTNLQNAAQVGKGQIKARQQPRLLKKSQKTSRVWHYGACSDPNWSLM